MSFTRKQLHNKMSTHSSEASPLVRSEEFIESTNESTASSSKVDMCKNVTRGLLMGFENTLDWSPFIVVSMITPPLKAFFAGTATAAFVVFYYFLKRLILNVARKQQLSGNLRPKILDLGQFCLFGSLYVIAFLCQESLSLQDASYVQTILLLWFNPLTTGGMGLIMLTSVLVGRPFVFDYAESAMPPLIWAKLSSKNWFRKILTETAIFWVKIMTAMTAIVSIQPVLVTAFYQGDVTNDSTGRMETLGLQLTVCQFVILFYGIFKSIKDGRRMAEITKRVRKVKQNGLTEKEKLLYGDRIVVNDDERKNHQIRSLSTEEELNAAGSVLADAFQNDDTMRSFLDSQEGKLSFYVSTVKAIACFQKVLACYDEKMSSLKTSKQKNPKAAITIKPQCVMACIPVFSKSQEEINVFNTYQAWVEYGFTVPGATESDFPLPDDELIELGKMKENAKNGLTRKPYILIAHFGADPAFQGKGYGRSLLKYIIAVSESQGLPLVLEATQGYNREHYERYGFKVVDYVKSRSEWVLMVRSPSDHRRDGYV